MLGAQQKSPAQVRRAFNIPWIKSTGVKPGDGD
jgi:hypothetical protein